jgi:hypothetical protein
MHALKYFVAKNVERCLIIYFPNIICSQIWLNLLMDDCCFGYIRDLPKKKLELVR